MTNKTDKKCMRVNEVDITCYCAGDGNDTIVLLHGAVVDSAMLSWAEAIPLLSSQYQVIAPDLPGYGASDRIDGEYTLSFYTDIVKGIIEALGGQTSHPGWTVLRRWDMPEHGANLPGAY
jgi:pimeloyl-ACP methyl ester carboxylesterase